MIELVIEERCSGCDGCVAVCPTNVLDRSAGGVPVIARQEDCQTCFMCELYCTSDAIFVAPECDRPVPIDREAIIASGLLGGFRRDSGWGEWRDDPRYPNLHWRMDEIFRRARGAASRDGGGNPIRPLPTPKRTEDSP